MLKFFLSLMLLSSLLLSSGIKVNGCDLSQVGDVNLTINGKNYQKVNYKAITPSGRNFKTIFIGSTISVGNIFITITDIRANKRIKKEARTGLITVDVNSEKVILWYRYDKGYFEAKGVLKNSQKIGFKLRIKALLCHTQ
ncbi:hypothetical protein [Sulfurimonas sp.]